MLVTIIMLLGTIIMLLGTVIALPGSLQGAYCFTLLSVQLYSEGIISSCYLSPSAFVHYEDMADSGHTNMVNEREEGDCRDHHEG